MSMEGLYPVKAKGIARVIVAGSFITVGSGNPAAASFTGQGFTVIREAAGRYAVTLDDTPQAIESVIAGIAPETIATELVAYLDQDTITATVFEIRVSNLAGALADDDGSRVDFIAVVRNSSVDY